METITPIIALLIHLAAGSEDTVKHQQNVAVVPAGDHPQGGCHSEFFCGQSERSAPFHEHPLSLVSFLHQLDGNSTCKRHWDIVRGEARKLNVGALRMIDATAKLPSGVLSGNLNQYGDFDECISSNVRSNVDLIKGRYCLSSVEVHVKSEHTSRNKSTIDDLIHSHRLVTNHISSAGHRIPKFETFTWGLCIPHSCTSDDLNAALQTHFHRTTDLNPLQIRVLVNEKMCFEEGTETFGAVNLFALSFFAALMALTVSATVADVWGTRTGHEPGPGYLQCFSLKRNYSELVKTENSRDDIMILHGLRFFNAVALLLSHKQMAMLFFPFVNRTQMSESLGKPWTMIGRSAILYTDSFILLSGLLISYTLIKELDERGKINFRERFISRLTRFTPNLFALIVYCTFIMEHTGSGPQWGLVVKQYADLCKSHMWRNFLYIHNYFGFENMCLTHTHQLGIDMQLFILSPIIIHIVWRYKRRGLLLLLTLGISSTFLRYYVTIKEGLSTIIYFGISVEQLWKTANLSYILPTHRFTVYAVGIALGYFLRRNGKRLQFPRWSVWLGWISAASSGLYAMFGLYHTSSRHYTYDAKDAAFYNAFAPVLWVIFLSWSIIASENGWGGWFSYILSWKYLTIFTRISYALYLTQFPVFFYNVGIQRLPLYYKGLQTLIDVPEFIMIFALSIAMTLLVELPCQNLRRLFVKGRRTVAKHQKTSDASEDIRYAPVKDYKRRRRPENHAD